MAEYTLEGPKLAPPVALTAEQRGFWRQIVEAFPAARFGEDHAPVMETLVLAMSRLRQVTEQLDEMRKWSLNRDNKRNKTQRSVWLELARAAREESKTIAMLAAKLRLVTDPEHTQQKADAERRATAVGHVVPWMLPDRVPSPPELPPNSPLHGN